MPALAIVDDDVARSPSGPSPEQLAERIDFVDEARKDSSRRLHVEIDELKRRFDAAQSRPVDVQRIRFSAPVLVAVVPGLGVLVLAEVPAQAVLLLHLLPLRLPQVVVESEVPLHLQGRRSCSAAMARTSLPTVQPTCERAPSTK